VHDKAEKPTSARGDAGCMCCKHRWRWVCRGGMSPSARVEQRRRDWSEDAHGARGPDGGAGTEHQGALMQALRMHLVLRVVRSGCMAGVSFELRGRGGQEGDGDDLSGENR
jgi:hypothetical protein